jgi:hypothetical protein
MGFVPLPILAPYVDLLIAEDVYESYEEAERRATISRSRSVSTYRSMSVAMRRWRSRSIRRASRCASPAGDPSDRRSGLPLQAAQRLLGQTLLLQVGQGVCIEGVGDVAGMEQLQEVDAALAGTQAPAWGLFP